MRKSTASVIVIVTCLAAVLGGCAGGVTSEVTRFHAAAAPRGEVIAVLALDPDKAGSLEFAAYARLISRKLESIGYRVSESPAGAELLARVDYSVGPAETAIKAWPRHYVHYHFYYGRYHPYYFGRYWDEPYSYSYTVYPRALDITIRRVDGESLFEGQVRSVGREASLNQVMPYLVEAMFQNFPGENGITKVVTIVKGDSGQPY